MKIKQPHIKKEEPELKTKLLILPFLILFVMGFAGAALADVEPSPFRSETNRLKAIVHMLGRVITRLENILSKTTVKDGLKQHWLIRDL